MYISFGQKIPIAKVQIQNTKTGLFESATVYELNCKDESDFDEVLLNPKDWNYNLSVYDNMQFKYRMNQLNQFDPENFYILKNQNDETLGIIQTCVDKSEYGIDWLDTKINKIYKYVGQNLIAVTSKIAQKQGLKSLVVSCALDDAKEFYIDKCGFQDVKKYGLYMDEEKMQELIAKTQEKTKCQIIDLNA